MGERSVLCWSMCCKKPVQKIDDGEWMEPIPKRRGKLKGSYVDRNAPIQTRSINIGGATAAAAEGSFIEGLGGLKQNENTRNTTASGGDDNKLPRKSLFHGNGKTTALKKRMTAFSKDHLKMNEHRVDTSAMTKKLPSTSEDDVVCPDNGKTAALTKRMTAFSKNLFSREPSLSEGSRSSKSKPDAITSIAVLSDGYFLTASFHDKVIKMFKQVPGEAGKVDLVREFRGHKSGITDLVTLDRKGRFLSAGTDKTIRLWDSRFDCEDDLEYEGGGPQEPMILLATFDDPERWVHSIGVLNEGSFVRPTDNIDMDMVAAMAKKTALDGANSVQRAAIQREIIECSGSFATASKNDKNINVWEMTVTDRKEDLFDENVAELTLAQVLQHDATIKSMTVEKTKNMILIGDSMGNVILFSSKRGSFTLSKTWVKLCKFTQRATLATPEAIMGHMITHLSFLEGASKFVAGSNNGTIRVWNTPNTALPHHEVQKKDAISMKITSESSLSGIQKLPSVFGEECLAFSVASTDGRVISMALSKGGNELVMFHDYNHSPSDDDQDLQEAENEIHSIAVSEALSPEPVLIIAGGGNGSIHFLKPKWEP